MLHKQLCAKTIDPEERQQLLRTVEENFNWRGQRGYCILQRLRGHKGGGQFVTPSEPRRSGSGSLGTIALQRDPWRSLRVCDAGTRLLISSLKTLSLAQAEDALQTRMYSKREVRPVRDLCTISIVRYLQTRVTARKLLVHKQSVVKKGKPHEPRPYAARPIPMAAILLNTGEPLPVGRVQPFAKKKDYYFGTADGTRWCLRARQELTRRRIWNKKMSRAARDGTTLTVDKPATHRRSVEYCNGVYKAGLEALEDFNRQLICMVSSARKQTAAAEGCAKRFIGSRLESRGSTSVPHTKQPRQPKHRTDVSTSSRASDTYAKRAAVQVEALCGVKYSWPLCFKTPSNNRRRISRPTTRTGNRLTCGYGQVDQGFGLRCWKKTVKKDDAHNSKWLGLCWQPVWPSNAGDCTSVRKSQACMVAKRCDEPQKRCTRSSQTLRSSTMRETQESRVPHTCMRADGEHNGQACGAATSLVRGEMSQENGHGCGILTVLRSDYRNALKRYKSMTEPFVKTLNKPPNTGSIHAELLLQWSFSSCFGCFVDMQDL
ncbi:hypothetical protein KCU59_g96, partial [Aureobasidium melanogenum]